MKLKEKDLLTLPENIRSFAGSKIWKEISKKDLLERLEDTDFSEIRKVGDYLDLYIGNTWVLTIGRYGGKYYVRNVGFENEKYMYLLYGAATGMYAAGARPAGSWAALLNFFASFGRWFGKTKGRKLLGISIVALIIVLALFTLKVSGTPVQFQVHIDTIPEGATVHILNEAPKTTPCNFILTARRGTLLALTVQKGGFEPLMDENIILNKRKIVKKYILKKSVTLKDTNLPILQATSGLPSPRIDKIDQVNNTLYLLLENGIVSTKDLAHFIPIYRYHAADLSVTPKGLYIIPGDSELLFYNGKELEDIAPTPFSLASTICYDGNSSIFIGCPTGLYAYNITNGKFTKADVYARNIKKLYCKRGILYIIGESSAQSSYENLYKYNISTAKCSLIKEKIDDVFPSEEKIFAVAHKETGIQIFSLDVNTNCSNSLGTIKVASPNIAHVYVFDKKVYVYTYGNGIYKNVNNVFRRVLDYPYITSMGEYQNKLIVGTMRDGLIDLSSNSPVHVPIKGFTPPLYFVTSKNLLLSARGVGVYWYSGDVWKKILSFKRLLGNLPGNSEEAFSEAEFKGTDFIGTDRTVYAVSAQVKEIPPLPVQFSGNLRNFVVSTPNKLLDFTEDGFFYLNGKFWKRFNQSSNSVSIRKVLFDSNRIYIATEDKGLLISDNGGKTFNCLKSIRENFISDVEALPNGSVVIATKNKVYTINKENSVNSIRIPQTVGFVTCVVSDKGSIYLGASKGLFLLQNNSVIEIDKSTIQRVISMREKNGDLFVSTGSSIYEVVLH